MVKIINLLTGEQNTGVSAHADTHHVGGTDALSAEAIGARSIEEAIPWPEISGKPFIKNFQYSSFAPFYAIPINFQNDAFAAYCCKLMGGGHIGGKGFGGFEFDFWVHKDTAPFTASLIREAYTGNATQGIILIAAASYGVDVRVMNFSTTGRQDMALQLSIAGTGVNGSLPIF